MLTEKQIRDLTALVASLHAVMNGKKPGSLSPEEKAVLRHSRSFLEGTPYQPWQMAEDAYEHLWSGDAP